MVVQGKDGAMAEMSWWCDVLLCKIRKFLAVNIPPYLTGKLLIYGTRQGLTVYVFYKNILSIIHRSVGHKLSHLSTEQLYPYHLQQEVKKLPDIILGHAVFQLTHTL